MNQILCYKTDSGVPNVLMTDNVDDIHTLRETSPAELELFSWMMVENMQPKVHPRMGDVGVDFVLTTQSGGQVAIGVDGSEYHEDKPTMDNARDAMLQGHGYRVVRVPARQIFETPYNVLEKIRQQAQLAH